MDEKEHDFRITPNPIGNFIAKMTKSAKKFLDKGNISYTGPGTDVFANVTGAEAPSIGFGEVLFGQGPEAIEDWAYGFPPIEGGGQNTRLKPEAIDIAALPTFGALGLAKATAKPAVRGLSKTLGRQMDVPVNEGRRDFLKNAGIVTAGAAAAATVPTVLTKALTKKAPVAAAKGAAKAVTRTPARQVVANMSARAMEAYKRTIARSTQGPNRYPKQQSETLQAQSVFKSLGDDFDVATTYSQKELAEMDDFIMRLPEDVDPELALRRVLNDPDVEFADYGRLGKKVDVEGMDRYNGSSLDDKANEALEAMYEVSGKDMDMWIATGKHPESYPDDLVEYLSMDYFGEASGHLSGWDQNMGMSYSPETKLHNYINSFVKNTDP